jgi:hypothetical protein
MAGEPEVNPEVKPEVTPVEKSSLQLQEEKILGLGQEEPKKDESDFEESVVDWDELMEKHPGIAKLGKNDLDEILTSYEGGLEQFNKDRELVAELEKDGYDTREKKIEALKQLRELRAKSGTTIPLTKGEETLKSFREQRQEKFSAIIPAQIQDPDTGEVRALTDEERKARLAGHEAYAETICPGDVPDRVSSLEMDSWGIKDELYWTLMRLEPILEQFKDKILPNNVRQDIIKHSRQFPKTYEEITQKAIAEGRNPYKAAHHHFISTTKADLIEAEKKKAWESEFKANEEKKKIAMTTEKGTKGGEPGAPKSFKDMTTWEKVKYIESKK